MPASSSALLARLQCGHEDVETTATLARPRASSSFALDDAETLDDDDEDDAVPLARRDAVTLARRAARVIDDDDIVENVLTDDGIPARASILAPRVVE